MIVDVPHVFVQDVPYITCPSSGGVTQPLGMFIAVGSKSSLRSPEEEKLDAFGAFKENWDSRGSVPPAPAAISAAREWLSPLREAAQLSGFAWRAPHLSASENGEVTFEWWRGDKKITLYFSGSAPEYVKVWGPNIFSQMASGHMMSSDSFRILWLWLNAA